MIRKGFIISVAAAFFLCAFADTVAAKERIDGIAIVVNNSIVTLSEYRKKEASIRKQSPEATKDQIVSSIISEQVMMNIAVEKNITVSAEEIKAALEAFKESLGLDDVSFVQSLGERSMTLEEFFAEMRIQLITKKLVQYEVERQGLTIDDKAVEDYYLKHNPGADRSPQVRIAHILMPTGGSVERKAAERIAEDARAGKPFEELARRHSMDARTAPEGGDLGYFRRDELILPLQKAVEEAGAGDIGGPVLSDAGFHIVKVLAVKEEGVMVPPEIKTALIDEMISRETERIISTLIEKGLNSSLIDVRI